MIRPTVFALAAMFAVSLALPALAQTAPSATTPDSGIKTATPDATPAKTPVKHHHLHAHHTAKAPTPTTAKS